MRSGAPAEAPSPFDFVGGRVSLDFVNTVSGDRAGTPRDRIGTYADLVRWAREAGIATEAEGSALLAQARRRPEEAERARSEALRLREALYGLFAAEAEGRDPPAAAADRLNRALADALPHRRLLHDGAAWRLGWAREPGELLSPLWPVVADAAELLAAGHGGRLRLCGGHEALECSWLFLDPTKSGTKRWCSMSDCGNRAKARRHYQRTKARAR
jgi:predicted RNA-binding Zn ribbon-like protein